MVVWGGIFGPDFCTIHRFRLIPILYQGKSSKTLYKSRPTCPKPGPGPLPPPKKNRGAHQSKVLGVRGSISGPDSCTIHRIRLISILYQGKSSNSLVSVHNCQKSKEEIRTSSEKKTRTKNINYSWRKLNFIFGKNHQIFENFDFFKKLFFSVFDFFKKIFKKYKNRKFQKSDDFSKKSKLIFSTNN